MNAPILIDARAHLLGRMCSIVAKNLLEGQKVIIVRCDETEISGSLVRNKVKFEQFLKKRTNTNPKRGPIHYRSPARIVWRTIRGMLPHKTARGTAALARLKCFEGIPEPYDTQKRMVMPDALRVARLKSHRRYTNLGELASEEGWKHRDLLARLEAKRKVRSEAYYTQKKALLRLKTKATAEADLSSVEPVLAAAGF